MLTVDFINVGYGDAILIRDKAAPFTMLVDCGDITVGDGGPGSRRVSAANFLAEEGIDRLDLLVLTHLHRDHSGGLLQVLEQVSVRTFWTGYLPPEEVWGGRVEVPAHFSTGARCLLESMDIYLQALELLRERGTAIRPMRDSGESFQLTPRLRAEVYLEAESLHRRQTEIWRDVLEGCPDGAALDELDRFINNTSIRLRLDCGGKTVELPGDVYAACWERHRLSPCDIVKLPHHGHRDSMTPRLLEMLKPRYAVISVSNSRTDDCPSKTVLELLRRQGCPLFITDAACRPGLAEQAHRAVRFSVDGEGRIKQEYVH